MMFGYTTRREAVEIGMTHEGSYYGIPLWMGDVDSEEGLIAFTKWAPLEYLMPAAHYVEAWLSAVLHPDSEPMFMFKVKGEIR